MKSLRPRIRFGMICAAIVLLCNPNINLIDILPDAIAYLLLAMALDTVHSNPKMSEARSGFLKLMWINVSKGPAALLMLMIWGSDPSQKSIISVFALAYAVIEIGFSLPAWSNFFDGLFYFGERYGAEGLLSMPMDLGKEPYGEENKSDGSPDFGRFGSPMWLPRLTAIFVVVKAVLSALPEMSLISVKEYTGDAGYSGSTLVVSRYYPIFLLIGFVLALVAGVIWASYLYRYIKHVAACGSVDRITEEIFLANREHIELKYRVRRFCSCLILFAIAVGFQIDLIFDDFNVLPDVISGVLFLLFGRMAMEYTRRATPLMIVAGVYSSISLVNYIFCTSFLSKYSYDMIERRESALAAYRPVMALSPLEMAAGVVMLVLVMLVVRDLITQVYIGSSADETEFDAQKTNEAAGAMKRKAVYSTVLGILSLVATCVQVYLNTAMEFVSVNSKLAGIGHSAMFVPRVEWFWMVPLVLSIAWLAVTLDFSADLRRTMEKKAGLL